MSATLLARRQLKNSAAKAWLRALELTAPIAEQAERILPAVIGELAAKFGESPALLSDRECFTYRALADRSNQYARWALDQGVARGETVCLLMPNRPEYLAIWLGVTRIGGVVALLNASMVGVPLARSINIVAPKHVIVDATLADELTTALSSLSPRPAIWVHGTSDASFQRIDHEIARYAGDALSHRESRSPTIEDRALYIYTSGTTGLPKATNISHGRLMQWTHWFAGMMDTQSSDRLYNCLPMHHASGGVQAPGAVLIGGGSVVTRDRFSAGDFWADVARWDCTLFQYIGELCRYLLHTPPSSLDTQHRIRMACGNGLRPDVWRDFQSRFNIAEIFEFYGATEGAVSLFNIEGEAGAIGRIPPYLAHRSPVVLVKYDHENEAPLRNKQGFCLPCAVNEAGEALGPFRSGARNVGTRFEGYTDELATENKIVRNVFTTGDAWFRTGDLMRKDERGFYYFVDRVGDTFRWKGENVAASEVCETVLAFPGVRLANVYGVSIPHSEGRAGMAALVLDRELDLPAFRMYLLSCLPSYACPLFVRVRNDLEITPTFKSTKNGLVRQAYDPRATNDVIYFNDPQLKAFVQLDAALYDRIQSGEIRL